MMQAFSVELPYRSSVSHHKAMLTGKALGDAIAVAVERKGVSKAELARHFGVKPPSIQDWINRGTIDKAKLPGMWAYFADVVGPEHWGLTRFPEPPPEYAGTMSGVRRVAIVGTARMGDDGFYDEISSVPGAGDGHIDIATADPNAYGLRVRGNSMAPAIRDGWYVLVEPNGSPTEGEYVLVKLKDGRKMVKEFLYRRVGSIELLSVNGGQRLTVYVDELESLQAVAAVVSPSKWKPD